MDFGAELRELRRAAGLTQSELAEELMVDITKVSRVENNVRLLRVDEYFKWKGLLENYLQMKGATMA